MITAAAMVAIFASLVGMASTYSPEARMAPLVIGLPGLGFSLIQLTREFRDRAKDPDSSRPALRRQAIMMGWTGAFVVAILCVGFLWGASTLVVLFARLDQRESLLRAGAMGALCFALLYGVFEGLLGLMLYRGAFPLL